MPQFGHKHMGGEKRRQKKKTGKKKRAKAKSSIFHKKSKPQRHRLSKTKEKKIGATKQDP